MADPPDLSDTRFASRSSTPVRCIAEPMPSPTWGGRSSGDRRHRSGRAGPAAAPR
jgi:hypothetical protein